MLSEGAALVDKAKIKVAWQLSSAIVSHPIGGLLDVTHEDMPRRSASPGP